MHTRQGVAEPAQPQLNPGQQPPFREYHFAHILRQGLNRSQIAVGPAWLEYLITLYVSASSRRGCMDAIRIAFVLGALLASAAVLLVGER